MRLRSVGERRSRGEGVKHVSTQAAGEGWQKAVNRLLPLPSSALTHLHALVPLCAAQHVEQVARSQVPHVDVAVLAG